MATPKKAPKLNIPSSDATCKLSIINTTCDLTVYANTLVEPPIAGHEYLNLPTIAHLITHASSGRQILFDLGCQKDFWNLPGPKFEVIEARVPGVRVSKDYASEVLEAGGLDLERVEAAVISHHHWDHTGDPSTFPTSMDLIVGPGFSEAFFPGYPTVQGSPLHESAFKGRTLRELDFKDGLEVAGYKAFDYFGDGSFYILETPGHAIGHVSGLVRTTADTFAFLGGDICHYGGAMRPTQYAPLPPTLTSDELGNAKVADETEKYTKCHPKQSDARVSPYYCPCSGADSWYMDPPLALKTIEQLKALDADERILVLIAHDPAILEVCTLFPEGNANEWFEKGWKAKLRWRFLEELPVEGKKGQDFLVDGFYRDGRRVKTLEEERFA
jgi:glyoxylase-like metal-dependent hydrolase (beta-lactamase superfamily II)